MEREILAIYLIIINAVSFAAFGLDKRKAVHHRYRIREATLLGISFIGGSLGAIAGMHIFHHKTQKPMFKYTVPLMLLLHILLVYYLYFILWI